MMPLVFAPVGEEVEIKKINGTPDVKQHLSDLGFHEGGKCTVVSTVPTGLIVGVKEARVALDRSLAMKINI
ncbi:MAG: FeoA family protein [Bulleidia sp.]|nr:FeoA family protein [Bulleidia sp.]